MEQRQFGPETARAVVMKVEHIRMSGVELASFDEREPSLASDCGIGLAALEARTILGSGAADRVIHQAMEAQRQRRPFLVGQQDWNSVMRLEGVVSLASSKIAERYMALEAAGSNSAKLGTAISVVSGIAGLIKTFL
jgi:hypothetical protein